MSWHRVHFYAVVRVPIVIEVPDGASDEEIVSEAERLTDLHDLLDNDPIEWAEDIQGYLIDNLTTEGDVMYDKERWVQWDKVSPKLIRWA